MNIGIFKVNQLGDNVVFLPVVQMLRERFPKCRLFIATTPTAAPLYDADIPETQRLVIPLAEFNEAWKHPVRLTRLLFRVMSQHLDGCIIADDQGNVAHLLALLAGGRIRAGMMRDFVKVPRGLTHVVPSLPGKSPALQNWEIARTLVRAFGAGEIGPSPPIPDLRHLLRDAIRKPGRIIIHPGASMEFKRWPLDRFMELSRRLAADFEIIWIEQRESKDLPLPKSITRVAPTSLQEFVHLLGTASLLVGNNSGPMNLAAAVGTPSVIISGPSHAIWDPIWHSERILILRDKSVPCLPCETERRTVKECANTENPMGCMRSWSTDTVQVRTLEWAARWACATPNLNSCANP